jgi:hypothetical protein
VLSRTLTAALVLTIAAACGTEGERMPIPKPACMWPIRITAGVNDTIDFRASNDEGDKRATIAAGVYYSPPEVAAAVAAALTAAWPLSWTVSISDTGHVTVSVPGPETFTILLEGGYENAAGALLGFDPVTTPDGVSATGQHQMQNCWFAPDAAADDTGDLDEYTRVQTVSEAGVVKGLQYGAEKLVRAVSFTHLPPHKVFIAEEGASTNEAIQRLLRYGWTRFRWFPDATDLATGTDYALHIDSAKSLPRNRLAPGAALYSLSLRMRKFVS